MDAEESTQTLDQPQAGEVNTSDTSADAATQMVQDQYDKHGQAPSHPELLGVPLPDTEPLLEYTCHT